MIFALVTSVGEGIMSTLFTPFVEHVLHGTPQDLGLIVAAQAVGGIAGGMVAAAAGHRIRAARLLGLGAVLFGLMDLAIFLYPLGYVAVWPAIVGMIIVGLPGALTLAGLITLFQSSSEDSYRGRVFGALSALEGISVLAGTLGAGYLSRVVGIVPVLAIQGGGYVVAGLVMLVQPEGCRPGEATSLPDGDTRRGPGRAARDPGSLKLHAAAHPGGRVQPGRRSRRQPGLRPPNCTARSRGTGCPSTARCRAPRCRSSGTSSSSTATPGSTWPRSSPPGWSPRPSS